MNLGTRVRQGKGGGVRRGSTGISSTKITHLLLHHHLLQFYTLPKAFSQKYHALLFSCSRNVAMQDQCAVRLARFEVEGGKAWEGLAIDLELHCSKSKICSIVAQLLGTGSGGGFKEK